MKVKAKILSAFVAGAVAVTAFGGFMPKWLSQADKTIQVSAEERRYDDASGLYYWRIDNDDDGTYDSIMIGWENYFGTSYYGKTAIDIPEEIDGLPVTKITDAAFYNCSKLEKVTIPKSISYIRDGAFYSTAVLEKNIIDGIKYVDT